MFNYFHVILLITFSIINMNHSIGYAEPIPNLTAKSAIVIESKTGKVIYAKDAETKRYPASTTKMMTLIVALEKGNLDDIVTASKNAAETEGSSLWLEVGERLNLLDLLYGIMLVSGNDATVAVAEHIAGSVDNFAKLMTSKAHEIGALDSSFVNSSGLPDVNHYSTAHDLTRIAAYGYKNPMFEQIVSTKEKNIPQAGKDHDRELNNENRMLWLYEGGNGVKTGYTEAAGRCLVSAAKLNGVQLIVVVLDSEFMWNDSIALMNYGFDHTQAISLFEKGDSVKTTQVIAGKKDSVELITKSDLRIPVVNGDQDKFTTVIDAPDRIYAKIEEGNKVGVIRILYDGVEVVSADLVAKETIEKKSFFSSMYHSLISVVSFLTNKFI